MLVMRILRRRARMRNSKLAGGRRSGPKSHEAASARGGRLMMHAAGMRIMSISGALGASTSTAPPADAHDAGLWGGPDGKYIEASVVTNFIS